MNNPGPSSRRNYRALHLALALACCASSGSVLPADALDYAAKRQAILEAARLLDLPPPAEGVREARWSELLASGVSPEQLLERAGVQKPPANAPDALKMFYRLRLQRVQSQTPAPAVAIANETPIRLTGFPVMPDNDTPMTRNIVLAPYYGACTIRRAPLASQMVQVWFKRPMPKNMHDEPIWVIGTLVPLTSPSRCGTVAYVMLDATWTRYPKNFAVPAYEIPRQGEGD
jgi:hypothetical protein